jgi:hypothetical protein
MRIRALTKVEAFAPAGEKEFVLALEVRPEPKMQLQYLQSVQVEKAVDDREQKLDQLAEPAPPGGLPAGGGVRILPARRVGGPLASMMSGTQIIPVRLKKGEKEAKVLEELSGTITAQVLPPAEPILTVDKIRKAVGETVKGKNGGHLKVLDVKEEEGKLTVKVEMDNPPGVVPAGRMGGTAAGAGRVLPARRIPAPVPPPAPPAPGKGGALPAQVPPAPVPAAQVQVQIGVAGGGASAPLYFGGMGLTLVDDKGEVISPMGARTLGRFNAGQVTYEHTLEFPLRKGQEPAKLVFSGSVSASVDIPFHFKDLPLE